jgi:hypothetical protein
MKCMCKNELTVFQEPVKGLISLHGTSNLFMEQVLPKISHCSRCGSLYKDDGLLVVPTGKRKSKKKDTSELEVSNSL